MVTEKERRDGQKQREADERQRRIVAAVGDFMHRQKAKRPGRAGAGGPLFDNQQAGCEGLDQ